MARLSVQEVIAFLGQTTIFRGCPPEVLAKLAPHVEQQSFAQGRPIVPPGMMVTTLNVLASGRATMLLLDPLTGARTALEEVFPGDTFGEVGLMLASASPIVVIAEEDCDALMIQKGHYEKVSTHVPDTIHALARRISSRFVKASLLGSRKGAPAAAQVAPVAKVEASPVFGKGVIPFVETADYSLSPKAIELVPTRTILEHRILPLELRGRTLVVGMVSPHSMSAKDELRRVLHSVDPEYVAISADDFGQTVVRLKLDVRDSRGREGVAVSRALRPAYQAEIKKEAEKQIHIVGDEVVSLLDRILGEAVERGVSDVHIEPEASGVRVRFRVQGLLVERKELIPASYAAPLAARIKVLAELDITERRLPQDGRIVAQFGTRELNFRVSTLAAARGEKVVIRILDPSDVMRPLEHIFLDPRAIELVKKAISATHGAIVVAGATGSGKSATLYSLLNHRKVSRPDNNIVTVEDPIEFLLPGLSQSPVNVKVGLEYPQIIRAVMRQDPDVLMVGEMRDPATANIMVEAALTGHLVLTSMHGSNVPSVIERFVQFGCDGVRLGQAIGLVVVQKLSRRLCSSCVKEEDVAPQLVEALVSRRLIAKGASSRLPRATGCEVCGMSGYRGRVPVIEVLSVDEDVRSGLAAKVPMHEILQKAASTGGYLAFAHCARLLMARRALSPADALSATD